MKFTGYVHFSYHGSTDGAIVAGPFTIEAVSRIAALSHMRYLANAFKRGRAKPSPPKRLLSDMTPAFGTWNANVHLEGEES